MTPNVAVRRGGPGKRVVAPALVGRGDELAMVIAAVVEPPAVVTVEGEAGIGKTRLVEELASRSEMAGRRLLLGRCHQIRESFPLGPVVEALRGVGRQLHGVQLSPVAGALRPLLPELSGHLPVTRLSREDRATERHRVFRGIREVLDAVGPAVLVLEDMHWADEQTLDLLGYLLAEATPGLSVVVTFRGREVDGRVLAATAKLPAGTSRTDVMLAPLDVTQTGMLAAAILGQERVPEDFAACLRERTAGLPFAVEELLALLDTRGGGRVLGNRWSRRTLEVLQVPAGIRDQVIERVSRLSGPARTVVEAAAVLHMPVPVPVLVAASLLPDGHARRGVEEALASGVLAEHGHKVALRHPLAAQVIYEALPLPRRQVLHSQAAAVLKALAAPPLGQVAHHLRHAGRLDEWPAAAERAADQAVALGHDDEAARLLEDLLRHAALDGPRRGQLALKLVPAAMEALRAPAVVGLVMEVLELELPRQLRGELRFLLVGLMEQTSNDRARVRRLLTEAAEDLDHRPDLAAWAMMGLGLPHVTHVRLAEHRRWLDRALAILPEVDDPTFQAFLFGKATMVLTYLRDPAGRRMIEGIMERTGGKPRQRHEVKVCQSVGLAACYVGYHEVAEHVLSTGLEGAIASESRRLDLSIRAALAVLDYWRGAWDGLTERVEGLIDQLANDAPARLDVEMVAGCLAMAQGNIDDARGRLAVVATQADVQGVFEAPTVAAAALARLSVALGEANEAVATVCHTLDALESKGFWGPVARALPAAVEAMIAGGQRSDARALVDRCESEFATLDAPLAPAALSHGRGLLEAATGRPSTAASRLLAAAEHYRSLRCPYDAAQASEQAAQCLFTADDERAGEALSRALATYQQLGASWDAARAASSGRRHGVPVGSRHHGGRRGYGSRLSPRQLEVAELAARGVGNKQIATELFISVNTVERHVSAVMRKLGVHSRTAMAYRLFVDGRNPAA